MSNQDKRRAKRLREEVLSWTNEELMARIETTTSKRDRRVMTAELRNRVVTGKDVKQGEPGEAFLSESYEPFE